MNWLLHLLHLLRWPFILVSSLSPIYAVTELRLEGDLTASAKGPIRPQGLRRYFYSKAGIEKLRRDAGFRRQGDRQGWEALLRSSAHVLSYHLQITQISYSESAHLCNLRIVMPEVRFWLYLTKPIFR